MSGLNDLQDIDALQSTDSALLPGLPFAFKTADAHYIPSTVLETARVAPSHIQLQKTYFRPDLETLNEERLGAQELGATEEWLKGLAARGRLSINDANRWVRWEASLPQGQTFRQVLQEYIRPQVAVFHVNVPSAEPEHIVPGSLPSQPIRKSDFFYLSRNVI